MSRTYAEILSLVQYILQDTGAATWATTELDVHIPEALTEVSRYKPNMAKLTLYTVEDTCDITLTAGDKHRLLWIDKAEYPVDNFPRDFHNVERWGDVITLVMDSEPQDDDESVYLYVAQKHRLQKEIGTSDVDAAVNALTAAGSTTLALKSLGTGTINKDTKLEIAGDDTDYTVIANATIATNAATVSIYPKLAAAAAADAVVKLTLSESTLDDDLETALAYYVAGKAAVSKSRTYINAVNYGGVQTPAEMQAWGKDKIDFAMRELRRVALQRAWREYPRGVATTN